MNYSRFKPIHKANIYNSWFFSPTKKSFQYGPLMHP